MKNFSLPAAALLTILVSACATPAKAPISADANPKNEIDRIEAQLETAASKQYDRLAPENFERAKKYRGAALEKLQEGAPNAEVMDEIAIAKHAIQEVERIGSTQGAAVQNVLTARQQAINAQAPRLQEKKFNEAENELENIADDMEEGETSRWTPTT
jgi:hypothetical protein